MTNTDWPYPGSRWWKFDFHTHTPASKDTSAWQKAIGTPDELTAEAWLLKYMAAGIDCVAVTDHNSGAWIDTLKTAYAQMKGQAVQGEPPEGFRELTLFPGVEISANSGVHILAIFDPSATTSTISSLLGATGFPSHLHGATDSVDEAAVTRESVVCVIEEILRHGGIPIPAHADNGKGLLQCREGSAGPVQDNGAIKHSLAVEGLLAVEWCDDEKSFPECVAKEESRLAKVLGSDCHSFQGSAVPGSRFTWVKMASPTLEGLRLALLDGNGVSIRRSDEGDFDPYRVPPHAITAIDIEGGRYIGNGRIARLECSPFFNAIVGGRGTGKSSVVHALRLAARREQELTQLGPDSEPRAQFDDFRKTAKGRDDKGALRDNTEIRVEWKHDEAQLRLRWRADGEGVVVEEKDGDQWQASSSQSVNAARFPLRIFSQGQIAAMAGSGRQTLLSIIDEAADVEPLKQAFEEAKRTFFTQRARLRELDGKLAGEPEVKRKLEETSKKLAALSQTDQASVLKAYGQSQHQSREVKTLFEQLQDDAGRISALAEQIILDDWPTQYFTEQDTDILALRKEIDAQIVQVRTGLQEQAKKVSAIVESVEKDPRYSQWTARVQATQQAHTELQQKLAAQGVSDPQAFARLTHEKQQLESQCKAFTKMRSDREELERQISTQRTLIGQRRQEVTQARKGFIQQALANNDHVRITVVPFGYDPKQTERELRELIDVMDDRFADDILNDDATEGMALELAQASESEKSAALKTLKRKLLDTHDSLGGRFRNYLQRKHEKSEFADHILGWAPEDDLRIQYKRENNWHDIQTGSQGQRSAALLAFLLAFGEEPIVLDQPEDDLDNHLIYDLIVRQIRENKLRRQLIIITHNPNVVVNGDAELVHVMEFGRGQCYVQQSGALQETELRNEVCRVMEGGHEAFSRRWKRLGAEF
ncbi:AAA family ATPase [Marinobacter sp. 1-3A]|uniref:TrlF family AAA-like ATPase n=1 Tax=Marinobacter sp. 1-3A TaxID=2582920 RepID=UPI0019033B91|nr:AAA family ATPase [Marinobacter sp. 1-3A]MBK1874063.1 AAA family ATPase [Marinobacter sp. 1-3A]